MRIRLFDCFLHRGQSGEGSFAHFAEDGGSVETYPVIFLLQALLEDGNAGLRVAGLAQGFGSGDPDVLEVISQAFFQSISSWLRLDDLLPQ